MVQGCLETAVNSIYYPYSAKFRNELVVPAPIPASDYERVIGVPVVVLGCAVNIDGDENEKLTSRRFRGYACAI